MVARPSGSCGGCGRGQSHLGGRGLRGCGPLTPGWAGLNGGGVVTWRIDQGRAHCCLGGRGLAVSIVIRVGLSRVGWCRLMGVA